MPNRTSKTGSELFIVDNSDADWKVQRYLHDWCQIIELIRSTPQTPRATNIERATRSHIRAKIEKHIKNTCLKSAQAPVGVKPVLKAWMELS